jgi:hypothetical protein
MLSSNVFLRRGIILSNITTPEVERGTTMTNPISIPFTGTLLEAEDGPYSEICYMVCFPVDFPEFRILAEIERCGEEWKPKLTAHYELVKDRGYHCPDCKLLCPSAT